MRLRAGLKVLGLAAAAVVVGAGLAVLVPAAAAPAAHAQAGGGGGVEQGMIVVGDYGNGRLQVFYPDGTFAFKFVPRFYVGSSDSIDVAPDGRIVLSTRNYNDAFVRTHIYHPNGSYASEFISGGGLVVIAPDGRIVVSESSGRFRVFSPDGTFESVFGGGALIGEGSWIIGHDGDVGPDGVIVVTDRSSWPDSGHIRAFHLNGTQAFSFATVGPYPIRVAAGPDGRVVVLEREHLNDHDGQVRVYSPLPNGTFVHLPLNGTISYLAPNGTLVTVPGIEAFSSGLYPYGDLDVDQEGRIVAGWGDYVTVFHPNGTRALAFGGYGSTSQGGFDRPTDAAVGPDGRIVVAEPGNRTIIVFHPNGTLDFAFGKYGHGDGAFYTPEQVAVGPDGRIVVGDTGKDRILVFEPDGTPALAFGWGGAGGGQVSGIRDVAVAPNGSVVVVDAPGYGDGRVQVFSPDGSAVSELRSVDYYYFPQDWNPTDAAVGPDGQIAVGSRSGVVYVFDPNGTESFAVRLVQGEGDVAVDVGPDGRILVVQGDSSGVFSPDGEFLFATEIDVNAVSVAVGPSREIVVVDDRDDRVQVFSPDGTFAFSLLPDLSDGKFRLGVGPIAVGPVMPPLPRGDPAPLWTSIEPEEGGGDAPILRDFTGAGDAANVTIDVGALAEGPGGADALNGSASSIVTFPSVETVVAASFAEVTFPPNVTASHVPAGGLLGLRVATALPTAEQVQAALGRSANGTGPELVVLLQSVVEVGGDQSRIAFDLPIRIALDGAAGGRAFYIEGPNGTIVPIDEACAADDVDAVHGQLGGADECQMDSAVGTAKIVYTYHLTKFGTVSAEGPVPVRTDAVDPPTVQPQQPPGGDGDGDQPVVPLLPVVVVPDPTPVAPPTGVQADTCAVSIDFPALDMSARPGEYSEPVEQVVFNDGTRPLERVEIVATPWHDGSGPPVPPPLPGVPPPYSGPTQGRTAGAFTAYMIASLPASVTEVREGPRVEGHQGITGGGSYVPLADDGSGTAVLEGLGSGAWAPLSFRLNLTSYDGLLAGALVQSVTYQAECVPLAPLP